MSWGNSWQPWEGAEGPIFTVGGLRVDLTLFLVGIHTFTMVLGAVLAATGLGDWVAAAGFHATDLKEGHIWTLLTYPFVHDIRTEGVWFALEMLMFFWFGREVESAIGRKPFAILYGSLALAPALLLSGLHPWLGLGGLAGSSTLSFAVFLAFCALHPGAQFFFGMPAKWVGWVLLGVYSLTGFAGRDWPGLVQLWSSALLAVGWIRKGGVGWPKILFPKGKRKGNKAKGASVKKSAGLFSTEKVDAILEKISKEGMDALTPAEKKLLEDARTKLLQKDRQNGPIR
ncbi:rhomboid family intramembrane serine protease [bacterium]|nr:rhomboid family intramembrane serine protease [bacterium]